MGRLPPSPCKICGSNNHWDKECSDYDAYEETRKRNVQLADSITDDSSENEYKTAYNILMGQRLSHIKQSSEADSSKLQDFHKAVHEHLVESNVHERKSERRRSVEIEDEVDIDDLRAKSKVKAEKHILEDMMNSDDVEGQQTERNCPEPSSDFSNIPDPPRTEIHETLYTHRPSSKPTLRLSKHRYPKPGSSAIGILVVAMKGYLCSEKNEVIDLRLDSCADISLISESYFNSLKDRPKIQQGLRMRLWQVTDKDCSLKGFVRIPVFCRTKDDQIIETEVEAYILPGMTVPILLGEDYQQNYEIMVSRSLNEGTEIHYDKGKYIVNAQPVDRTTDFGKVRESAHLQSVFLKSKIHRRNKNKRHRKKVQAQKEMTTVRIAEDVRLKPGETRLVRVQGNFSEDREWLIERNLLANPNDAVVAVPNVLISAKDPRVPLANPTTHPRVLRKGEIVGQMVDPGDYFDKPRSEEERIEMERKATSIAAIIAAQIDSDSKRTATPEPEETKDEHL